LYSRPGKLNKHPVRDLLDLCGSESIEEVFEKCFATGVWLCGGGRWSGVFGDSCEFFLKEQPELLCGIGGVFIQERLQFICQKLWGVLGEPI